MHCQLGIQRLELEFLLDSFGSQDPASASPISLVLTWLEVRPFCAELEIHSGCSERLSLFGRIKLRIIHIVVPDLSQCADHPMCTCRFWLTRTAACLWSASQWLSLSVFCATFGPASYHHPLDQSSAPPRPICCASASRPPWLGVPPTRHNDEVVTVSEARSIHVTKTTHTVTMLLDSCCFAHRYRLFLAAAVFHKSP